MSNSLKAVLIDVDGTLVDSNDAHAAAWVKAFTEHGVVVDPVHVRRCIGMGGDKLMPDVSGLSEDSEQGAAIAQRRGEIFKTEHLPHLRPFKGAAELVAALKALGLTAVAASSASKEDLEALLRVAKAQALLDDATSSDDAQDSKPAPDIVEAALKLAGAQPHEAIMIGDTPYDIQAAQQAGVRTIAFRSGGWNDDDLQGAIEIYDGAAHLLSKLAGSALVRSDAA